jgi:hypothetical protein
VPVILEPCDWLSSPFAKFMALPKDGQSISGFTNPNIAYLDVVTGLRRVLDGREGRGPGAEAAGTLSPGLARRPRIRQDFDSIQRAEYADEAFAVIREYFRKSCAELARIGDDLHLHGRQPGEAHRWRGPHHLPQRQVPQHGLRRYQLCL